MKFFKLLLIIGVVFSVACLTSPNAYSKDDPVGSVTIQEKVDCRAAWFRAWARWSIYEDGGQYFSGLSLEETVRGKDFWHNVLVSDFGGEKKAKRKTKKIKTYLQDLKGMGDGVTASFTKSMIFDDCKGLQRIVEEERGMEVTYPNAKSAAETLAGRRK